MENLPDFLAGCGRLLSQIDSLKLPIVRTIIAEYTDAGPGVGISNTAVRFRYVKSKTLVFYFMLKS